jgi:hypothetical protein
MIGTPITIRNNDTGEEIVINDHSDPQNVIALQGFPTFQTDIRTQNTPLGGSHGESEAPVYYSGKPIILRGIIVGEDEENVWALKNQLDEIMRLPRSGYGKEVAGSRVTPAFAVNLCSNPRGSVSSTGWTGSNAAISALDGIRVVSVTDALAEAIFEPTASVGQVLHFACDIRNGEDGDRTFSLSISAYDGASLIDSEESDDVVIGAGRQKRIYVSMTVPATTDSIKVSANRISDDDADAGDIFTIDRVFIIADPVSNIDPEVTYFDGDTLPITTAKFEWDGAEGLSTTSVYKMSFASMGRRSVRLSFINPAGQSVFIDATPIQAVQYDRPIQQQFLLNFQVILRSNFPYLIVDDPNPLFRFGYLGKSGIGFKVPTYVPFNIGNQYTFGGFTITTNSPSFAIIRMYGSDEGTIVNPKVTNVTNGDFCKINKPIFGKNRFFLIDGVNRKIQNEMDQSVVGYMDGDFIRLDEGENTIIYTADKIVTI